jgi:hypothetical protein
MKQVLTLFLIQTSIAIKLNIRTQAWRVAAFVSATYSGTRSGKIKTDLDPAGANSCSIPPARVFASSLMSFSPRPA